MVEREGRIQIELPVEKEFARLLRLMVSGIASRMNFNVDAVDDLKIAVEEAYLMAMRRGVVAPLTVAFIMRPDRLQIDFAGQGTAEAGEAQSDSFGSFILDAVIDELQVDQNAGSFDLKLTKYLS